MPFCDGCAEDDESACDLCDGRWSWEDDWQEYEDDPRMCCLGDACLNPHLYHTASECFDLEMCQQWEAEGTADSSPSVRERK